MPKLWWEAAQYTDKKNATWHNTWCIDHCISYTSVHCHRRRSLCLHASAYISVTDHYIVSFRRTYIVTFHSHLFCYTLIKGQTEVNISSFRRLSCLLFLVSYLDYCVCLSVFVCIVCLVFAGACTCVGVSLVPLYLSCPSSLSRDH